MTRLACSAALTAMYVALAAPALADMDPDMTCQDFTTMVMTGGTDAAVEATKVLKAAAEEAGTLPQKLAETTAVGALANVITDRCNMNPGMSAMDAMLEGH